MISTFQTALIDYLKGNGFNNVKDYFGEFTRPSDAKIFKTFLPGIMVDFVEATPKFHFSDEVTFSLYLIHATYSKQESLRTKDDMTLLDFVHAVRQSLYDTSLAGSYPIEVKRVKKIFDDAKDGMYLSVYQMAISTTLNYPTEEEC